MIWPLLFDFIGLVPLLIVGGIVMWRKRQLDQDPRRDPLTTELLRLPGDSLQTRMEDLSEQHQDQALKAFTMGLILAIFLAIRRIGDTPAPWQWTDGILLLAGIIWASLIGWKITKTMPLRRRLWQALRAEQATAQEMADALIGDNRLIHDVQAGEFNIDHVVITPGGVFAVETKSRLKPPSGNGPAKVKYDGRALDFGSWQETKPLEQAARQAHWLAGYLKKSTGKAYEVTAVLALPGWFVEPTARIEDDMVRVINPKNTRYTIFPSRPKQTLNAEAIQQAAFQIEKLAQAKNE